MRVTFAGTPRFAARALEAILAAGHDVPLVLTQPDRPAGRNQRPMPSTVKLAAIAHGLSLYQPERLKTSEQQAPLIAIHSEVMVVAAYGLILPPSILEHPEHGCLNIHASLLPRWRGAAPIQRAILAGDAQTGVCIMRMEAGLDTGPVVSRHPVEIAADDTAGTLHDKLAGIGATAIVAALATLARNGGLKEDVQAETGVTYAAKIEKSEARIDWNRNAGEIVLQIRAFNPSPGAATSIDGEILKIWSASVSDDRRDRASGDVMVIDGEITVGCGDSSAITLGDVQPASGRRMNAMDYAKGRMNRGIPRLGT
ncbi:MAG: methionyl-tRNA formyltransferase [Casimicrobiaceae bacterium]